jgi:phosphate uptake regulator
MRNMSEKMERAESIQEEFRRVQVTGRGSYMIYLPKKWVETVGLKQGESIFVSEGKDNSLILIPRQILMKTEDKKEVKIDVSLNADLESTVRKVIAFYLIGYNIIRLSSTRGRFTSDQKDYIRETIRSKLVGTEIVTASQNTMTIQVLLSYPELTVDNALRRMIAITLSMHEDAVNALKNLDKDLASDIIRMDDEVDRFNFYIIRQLKLAVQHPPLISKIGLTNPKDCLGFRLITKSIERIADHATNIAKNILTIEANVDPKLYSKIIQMSSFVSILIKDVGTALFRRDYELAEEVIKKSNEIVSFEDDVLTHLLKSNLSPNDLSRLRIILESIRRTSEYGTDIAEIILNLHVNNIN